MHWTKCLVTNDILNRICYNRARKLRVSVRKGGHPYIAGIRDTAGLLLGVQSQLEIALNTYLLTILEVEITSCRCWFFTWCVPQGVSRIIVCCKIRYDLLNVAHLNFIHFPLLNNFKPMLHLFTPWKRQKTCNFLIVSGRKEMDYWQKIG